MNPLQNAAPVELLLVEDSLADAELFRVAVTRSERPIHLEVARDGYEALARLRREGRFVGTTRPDLIFLDLNMPGMDGREVLSVLKKDPELLDIPVVVLTTSSSPDDVRAAYTLHANAYLTKSMDFSEFRRTIEAAFDFWCRVAKLPVYEPKAAASR